MRWRSCASESSGSCSSARPSSRKRCAFCTRARSWPARRRARRPRQRSWRARSSSSRRSGWSRWSRAATWPRIPPLLSWPDDEARDPSRIRARDGALRLRERVPDALDEARAARRGVLELPPVLHGQAEADGLRRPGRALPAPAREGRPQGLRVMSAPIGGQAVLEGVMMRGPSNWAVAVRKPNGQIAEVCRPIESVMKRHWVFRLPIVRGVIALGESLAIGFRALSISANYAAAEEGEEAETELSRGAIVFAFLIAIGFAISVFKVGPALLADLLPISNGTWFVVVEGLIRVSVFVAYLILISLLP